MKCLPKKFKEGKAPAAKKGATKGGKAEKKPAVKSKLKK